MKTATILAALVFVASAFATEPLPVPPYYSSNAKIRTLYDTHAAQTAEIDALRLRVAELEAAATLPPAPNPQFAEIIARLDRIEAAIPLLVKATPAGTKFTLTWNDNSTNETGFRIERSRDGTTWAQIAETAANVTSYVDAGLSPGAYWYRLRAFNAAGNSGYSNTAHGTL